MGPKLASKVGLLSERENCVRNQGDEQARMDEIGHDPAQVGPGSAGQSGDLQRLSAIEDVTNESVQELADSDQSMEAATVEGVEDAADHPERPVHTHLDYGRPDDLPATTREESLANTLPGSDRLGLTSDDFEDVDVEDLPDKGAA
jgi:hypothetical protein